MEANLAVAPPLEGARARIGIMETRLRWRIVPGSCGRKAARRSNQPAVRVLGAIWILENGALTCHWTVASRCRQHADAVA